MIVHFINELSIINTVFDITLISVKFKIENPRNNEQKTKVILVLNLIAHAKSEMSHLQNEFNQTLGYYYY